MTQATLTHLKNQILQAGLEKNILRITGSGSKDWYGNNLKGTPLLTKEYQGIINYQPDELVITVRSGTSVKEVEETLAKNNQQFAFEPPHFKDATIGGMVCSGLAGPGRAAVGGLRDFVLGANIMDGQGQIMSFGGTVMKNVAGYDVSRLLPGSLGTLALLLDVSIKVLPKPAASATLQVSMQQANAIALINQLASQPWPINASCWIGETMGTLYIRLNGAKAAVQTAITAFHKEYGMQLISNDEADHFCMSIRDQQHPWFEKNSEKPLWRLAVSPTNPPLQLTGETLLEWHGGQRWYRGNITNQEIKTIARLNGGHAHVFKASNKTVDMFSSLKDNPLTAALAPIEQRLRKSFDPQGVFATERLI